MVEGTYTANVKRLAKEIRTLSIGELIALREALREDFDILPPDIGVREPHPSPKPTLPPRTALGDEIHE